MLRYTPDLLLISHKLHNQRLLYPAVVEIDLQRRILLGGLESAIRNSFREVLPHNVERVLPARIRVLANADEKLVSCNLRRESEDVNLCDIVDVNSETGSWARIHPEEITECWSVTADNNVFGSSFEFVHADNEGW